MSVRWKAVFGSAIGSSHLVDGLPCQDDCLVAIDTELYPGCFVAVCCDGAGSARFGGEGARIATQHIVERCLTDYFLECPDAAVSGFIDVLITSLHAKLDLAADEQAVLRREFACTLLVCVQRPSDCVCFQIGDGAMVVERSGVSGIVVWPMAGEFAGTTHFVTDIKAATLIERVMIPGLIERLAMFTDGLERLALDFQGMVPHRPLLTTLWDQLTQTADPEELKEPLLDYLQSPSVCSRTDDDKSLILVVRDPSDVLY